ncbi:hypothetical protein [Microbacterium thalassium]|uniref:Alpha/beta hydrolase n=1 Tax=Microbacterium thalassium TaxID=362649 RepID=A0A7X0FMT8_9MICO|nr:hypothetical protein [Microbacterium thalassium]MBB6390387.1 hypothetical protein [Microbacterium thalassium]
MSDDEPLQITGGGAIAVDTDTLRHTAARFALAGTDLEDVCAGLGPLANMLAEQHAVAWDAACAASALAARIRGAIDGAAVIAGRLRETAAVYELVELNVEHRAAFFAGDHAAMARIDARRADIVADHPGAGWAAFEAESGRAIMWPGDLVRQATEAGVDIGGLLGPEGGIVGGVALGGGAILATAVTGIGGFGIVPRDARLTGPAQAVTLVPVAPAPTTPGAPQGLSSAAERIPRDGDARVRVEKYTMADGTNQFAVYVAGMRSAGIGGEEPWDGQSNLELYSGQRSASYQATVDALAAAGAEPGDVVHAFGHSQGAMVASRLALEEEYDTRTLVTFGSPIDADVGTSTLSVSVRHTDDPVVALAGGGHMGAVGAEGSMVIEREAHPVVGPEDMLAPGHDLVGYTSTAALVDASSDPRVDAVRDVFADLRHATEMDVFEFAATRDDSGPSAVPPVMG